MPVNEEIGDPRSLIYSLENLAIDPFQRLVDKDATAFVRDKILSNLAPRQRRVLILRFGLSDGGQELSVRELTEMYGVTRERIRQLINFSILKLVRVIVGNKDYRAALNSFYNTNIEERDIKLSYKKSNTSHALWQHTGLNIEKEYERDNHWRK